MAFVIASGTDLLYFSVRLVVAALKIVFFFLDLYGFWLCCSFAVLENFIGEPRKLNSDNTRVLIEVAGISGMREARNRSLW